MEDEMSSNFLIINSFNLCVYFSFDFYIIGKEI